MNPSSAMVPSLFDPGGLKRLQGMLKANRRRLLKACKACRSAKVKCEALRPCKRCVDKGCAAECAAEFGTDSCSTLDVPRPIASPDTLTYEEQDMAFGQNTAPELCRLTLNVLWWYGFAVKSFNCLFCEMPSGMRAVFDEGLRAVEALRVRREQEWAAALHDGRVFQEIKEDEVEYGRREKAWEESETHAYFSVKFDPHRNRRTSCYINPRFAEWIGCHREEFLTRVAENRILLPSTQLRLLLEMTFDIVNTFQSQGLSSRAAGTTVEQYSYGLWFPTLAATARSPPHQRRPGHLVRYKTWSSYLSDGRASSGNRTWEIIAPDDYERSVRRLPRVQRRAFALLSRTPFGSALSASSADPMTLMQRESLASMQAHPDSRQMLNELTDCFRELFQPFVSLAQGRVVPTPNVAAVHVTHKMQALALDPQPTLRVAPPPGPALPLAMQSASNVPLQPMSTSARESAVLDHLGAHVQFPAWDNGGGPVEYNGVGGCFGQQQWYDSVTSPDAYNGGGGASVGFTFVDPLDMPQRLKAGSIASPSDYASSSSTPSTPFSPADVAAFQVARSRPDGEWASSAGNLSGPATASGLAAYASPTDEWFEAVPSPWQASDMQVPVQTPGRDQIQVGGGGEFEQFAPGVTWDSTAVSQGLYQQTYQYDNSAQYQQNSHIPHNGQNQQDRDPVSEYQHNLEYQPNHQYQDRQYQHDSQLAERGDALWESSGSLSVRGGEVDGSVGDHRQESGIPLDSQQPFGQARHGDGPGLLEELDSFGAGCAGAGVDEAGGGSVWHCGSEASGLSTGVQDFGWVGQLEAGPAYRVVETLQW